MRDASAEGDDLEWKWICRRIARCRPTRIIGGVEKYRAAKLVIDIAFAGVGGSLRDSTMP